MNSSNNEFHFFVCTHKYGYICLDHMYIWLKFYNRHLMCEVNKIKIIWKFTKIKYGCILMTMYSRSTDIID